MWFGGLASERKLSGRPALSVPRLRAQLHKPRGERISREVKARALDMYLNNVGIRKVARFVGASPASVVNWIRKARLAMAGQLRQAADALAADGQPDIIEMDEIYTYAQKNGAAPSYGLLIVDGRIAWLRITSETKASPVP